MIKYGLKFQLILSDQNYNYDFNVLKSYVFKR